MGQFNANEVDNYGGQGTGGFFSLKNDRDVATVRFMYNTMDDVKGHAVHEVEVDGKHRYVNCVREYNEPVNYCPLCEAQNRVLAKFFVPLFDEASGEIKIWDRGRTFTQKISGLCARYNPLVSTPFEIERQGKKGDTATRYETFALETDGTTLEDLPEVPELLGTLILDKSFEELAAFVANGAFPSSEEAPAQQPARQPVGRQAAPVGRPTTPPAPAARRATPAAAQPAPAAPAAPRRRPTTPSDKF